MSKFNSPTKGSTIVENHEGAKGYSMSAKMELYTLVVTSSLENKFYESNDERVDRLRKLIKLVDPIFVAKLAVYARNKMYLRSIPLVLVVELVKIHNGDELVQKMINGVVKRADEISELLAYYQFSNSREGTKKLNKISNQILKGLQNVFNNFDEYQFAKYNRQTEVTLKDALFLAHPKAKDEDQQKLFDKIAKDELEVPYTWEVELSKLGQRQYDTEKDKDNAFQLKWEELIASKKLGYMALLRNLRNILDANVSKESIIVVCETLSNPEIVKKSRQFPFRFLSAYKELEGNNSGYTSMVLNALEDAIKVSVENLKGFDYDTSVLIASDVSGSMHMGISERSKIEYYDIGLVLSMLLQNKCKNVITGIFGDLWKIKNMPKDSIIQNVMRLRNLANEVGYSTNGYKVIEDLLDRKEKVDKIMMFTDCQLWDSSGWEHNTAISELWRKYKKFSPNSQIYLFDLSGYGNTPISLTKNDAYMISGWSDKIFDILEAIDKGGDAITEINKIEL